MSLLDLLHHVIAACLATTNPKLPPRLLVAVAMVETRLQVPPPVSRPHGSGYPAYCGAMQTAALDEADCARQGGSLVLAYRRGVAELEQWLADPRVRGDVRRAIIGHGCGNAGLAANTCHVVDGESYEARVFGRLAAISLVLP